MSPEEGIVYLEIGESFPLSCTFPNIATYMLKISWLRDADAVSSGHVDSFQTAFKQHDIYLLFAYLY